MHSMEYDQPPQSWGRRSAKRVSNKRFIVALLLFMTSSQGCGEPKERIGQIVFVDYVGYDVARSDASAETNTDGFVLSPEADASTQIDHDATHN